MALVAERRIGRETAASLLLFGLLSGFQFGLFLGQKRLLMLVQPRRLEHADLGEMALDHVANFGDQRWNVLTLVPVAALGIKHRAQLLHQKSDIPTLAEYGGDDACQRHNPLVVFQAL